MQTAELMKGSPVRALADGFFRQRRLFAAVFVIVLLPVVVSTLIAKKQYRSEMKFLLENNRSNAVITAGSKCLAGGNRDHRAADQFRARHSRQRGCYRGSG